MLFQFIIFYHFFLLMNLRGDIMKEIEFIDNTQISLKEFFRDLSQAIETQNTQSVYRLSKIITRQQLP